MRVSTSQLFRQSIGAIVDNQARLARTQNQLSSGRQLLGPADDPAAAAKALALQTRIGFTQQLQDNIGFARQRLATEENALDAALNVLQRVRELAIAANDAALDQSNREAIAAELRVRFDELLEIGNTRDANGEYVFAGFQGATKPFSRSTSGGVSYAGDQGQRTVQVGTDQRIAIGDSGADVFLGIRNGNGTFSVAPDAANTGSGVIDPGSLTDPSAYDGDTYTLTMASLTAVAGGAIGIVDSGTNDTLSYQISINGTLVDTLNEGDTRTLTQLETAINAQQGITGVRAHVDAGALYLVNTSPGGAPITVGEQLLGASEDTDTVTGYFGSNLTGLNRPAANVVLGPQASGFVVLDSASSIETSGAYSDGVAIAFNGIETNVREAPAVGDRFTLAPSVNRDIFTTLDTLAGDLSLGGAPLENAINRFLEDVDRGVENLVRVRTAIGARVNSLDSQENLNEDFGLALNETLSSVRDLDYAEAASRLNQELVTLQAAQQAFIAVQDLSLFNFLR